MIHNVYRFFIEGRMVCVKLLSTQQSTAICSWIIKIHSSWYLWCMWHLQMLPNNCRQMLWHPRSWLQILFSLWEFQLSWLHHREVLREWIVENHVAHCGELLEQLLHLFKWNIWSLGLPRCSKNFIFFRELLQIFHSWFNAYKEVFSKYFSLLVLENPFCWNFCNSNLKVIQKSDVKIFGNVHDWLSIWNLFPLHHLQANKISTKFLFFFLLRWVPVPKITSLARLRKATSTLMNLHRPRSSPTTFTSLTRMMIFTIHTSNGREPGSSSTLISGVASVQCFTMKNQLVNQNGTKTSTIGGVDKAFAQTARGESSKRGKTWCLMIS